MPKIRVITAKFPSTLAVLVTASVGVALAVGIASPAGAATPTRVTEGQAQAVFQSQLTGGSVVRDTPALPHAAPIADEVKPVIMSPVASGPDEPFCVLDWHVIRVSVQIESEFRSVLEGTTVQIWLDGAELAITRTAIKPWVNSPLGPGFVQAAFGVVVPPGTPTAGPHTLTAAEHFGDGEEGTDQTTINVGSADSPQCTGS